MDTEKTRVKIELNLKAEASLAKQTAGELEQPDPSEEEALKRLKESEIVHPKGND